MSWKWVMDSQNSKSLCVFPGAGESLLLCTAPLAAPLLWLWSVWTVKGTDWRDLHRHLHRWHLGKEWNHILFLISESYSLLGKWRRLCSPWPTQSLTLSGAHFSTSHFAAGTQKGPVRHHQTRWSRREELPKLVPPQGLWAEVLQKTGGGGRWTTSGRHNAPDLLQEAALVPGSL